VWDVASAISLRHAAQLWHGAARLSLCRCARVRARVLMPPNIFTYYIHIHIYIYIIYTAIAMINAIITMGMGPGPGLVARVLWLYCMRLASSGVGGVRRDGATDAYGMLYVW